MFESIWLKLKFFLVPIWPALQVGRQEHRTGEATLAWQQGLGLSLGISWTNIFENGSFRVHQSKQERPKSDAAASYPLKSHIPKYFSEDLPCLHSSVMAVNNCLLASTVLYTTDPQTIFGDFYFAHATSLQQLLQITKTRSVQLLILWCWCCCSFFDADADTLMLILMLILWCSCWYFDADTNADTLMQLLILWCWY